VTCVRGQGLTFKRELGFSHDPNSGESVYARVTWMSRKCPSLEPIAGIELMIREESLNRAYRSVVVLGRGAEIRAVLLGVHTLLDSLD